MKKKVLLIGLIFVMLLGCLLGLTGCGAKKEEKKEEQVAEVVDESLIKINGHEFKLDTETTFKDVSYTTSAGFKKADFNRYIQYYYQDEEDGNLLYFRIFYYENKDIAASFADLGLDKKIALTDEKTDNFEYKSYVEPRNDGGTIHCYFVDYKGSTYVISFISKYDIKDYETKVMKSIKFKE